MTETLGTIKTEQRAIGELIPFARNSRTHSDEQVAQIAASIREFGWTNPILVDGANGIIAGHGRLAAARKLGMTQIPVIVLDHLTEAQKRALVIADNKLALNAGWDTELLSSEIEGLGAEGFDLSLLGFNEAELAALLAEKTEGLTDPDDIPEPPADPVSVLGDVWVLGKHRIVCGDSTSIDVIDGLMAGEIADLVFTDPPYGVEYQSNMRTKTAKFEVLANDDQFLDIAPIIEVASKGWVFVWTSWKVQARWLEQMQGLGYPTNMVIWHKPGGGIGDLKKTFASDYEVALVWNRGAELCGKRIGSVWTINKDGASTYKHPTQKPVALAEEAIDKTTRPGAVVLDLFSGSGSTLIACERAGRLARVAELSPAYVDVAVKRWEQFTGQQAVHAETGKTFAEMADKDINNSLSPEAEAA
jgi:DNA modification methylase